jgi:hypothetical protein
MLGLNRLHYKIINCLTTILAAVTFFALDVTIMGVSLCLTALSQAWLIWEDERD